MAQRSPYAALPSVDRLLRSPVLAARVELHGRANVVAAIHEALAEARERIAAGNPSANAAFLAGRVSERLEQGDRPTLAPVINLTGTILHTNLGRAPLPEEAIAAMVAAARGPVTLEYDVATGRRGDRDTHLAGLLCDLTGAEAATVVNNNAAAVMLALNTLARRKEVPVSRGELIEIGGSFRLPDIMARAGCRLVEVGTTNRTHAKDFAAAVGPRTGLLLKVHTSNYAVKGFTAAVPLRAMADIVHRHGVPLLVDLGSGTLVDLARWGLPHEPTPAETLAAGADLVSFSGDKLLGGPQAGILVGRADLIDRIRANPMRRAMRLDKVTIAALAAVLRLYRDPDRLAARLPVLRTLTRPVADIRALAERLRPVLGARLADAATVTVVDCMSEVGSGSLPLAPVASAGLAVKPKARGGGAVGRLAAAFRALPLPVVGRIHDGALLLDLRTLEDESGFAAQLENLTPT